MANDEDKKVLQVVGCLTMALLTPVVLAGAALLRGFVLSVLWGYFLTPVTGAPPPGVALCVGLCVVAAFLTHQSRERREGKVLWSDVLSEWAFVLTLPLISWGAGWLVHLFL